MPRVTRALATAAVAAGLVSGVPAHAANPLTVCREVTVGLQSVVSVCVGFDAGRSGTTVAPTIYWGCTIGSNARCTGQPIGIGTTGFIPNLSYPAPAVDPATGSVRVYPGTIGTLWVDGQQSWLVVSGFCVGDPSIC